MTPPNAPAPAVAGWPSALTVFPTPPPPGAQLSSPVAIHQKNTEAKAPNVPGMKNHSPRPPNVTRTAAITPTPSAIPQKSGRSAIAGESHMTTSAATAPNTLATTTLRAAAPSPPAAKYIAHDTNAAGTISWKFDGRSSPLPRSPSVIQWKLKFSATQVHTNARIPTAAARGSRPFIRSAMLRLLSGRPSVDGGLVAEPTHGRIGCEDDSQQAGRARDFALRDLAQRLARVLDPRELRAHARHVQHAPDALAGRHERHRRAATAVAQLDDHPQARGVHELEVPEVEHDRLPAAVAIDRLLHPGHGHQVQLTVQAEHKQRPVVLDVESEVR